MISGSASGVWTYETQSYTPPYHVLNEEWPILKYGVSKGEDWTYDGRNIFKGSSKVTSIKYGTKDVKYVYVGDTCVYEYNTGVQKIQGSSYVVAHLFMENNDTPHLSRTISSSQSAIEHSHKMMIYEGFYIKPFLYKNGSAMNMTSSNFTIDVWIKDIKLSKHNYTDVYAYYYDEPENIVAVYAKSGIHYLHTYSGDFIPDTDMTRLREGCLLFFNLNQFSGQDEKPSSSPGVSLLPTHKPFYRIQVSNTYDSLVVVGESGTYYTTYG